MLKSKIQLSLVVGARSRKGSFNFIVIELSHCSCSFNLLTLNSLTLTTGKAVRDPLWWNERQLYRDIYHLSGPSVPGYIIYAPPKIRSVLVVWRSLSTITEAKGTVRLYTKPYIYRCKQKLSLDLRSYNFILSLSCKD